MKRNESWVQFLNRAKKNGVSPTRQEEWDRAEEKSKAEYTNCPNCGHEIEIGKKYK